MKRHQFKERAEALGFNVVFEDMRTDVPRGIVIRTTYVKVDGFILATISEHRRFSAVFNAELVTLLNPNTQAALYKLICSYDYTEIDER